jgi:vacuolar iron transporter family protein
MHQEKHLQSSALLTDIVIGMSDGLTVPFALAAGLSGAVASNAIVITAGIAEIVAGCIAMGLGGYLAGRTEQEHYAAELQREYDEVKHFRQKEIDEVKEIFAEYGIDNAGQEMIVQQLIKDEDKWVDFMMRFELGLEKPAANRARNSAITIGASYCIGGLLPLSAYFFTPSPQQGLMVSAAITTCCLFVFGYVKAKVTGQNPWTGALRVTAIGLIAASAAFGIAKLVGGH